MKKFRFRITKEDIGVAFNAVCAMILGYGIIWLAAILDGTV